MHISVCANEEQAKSGEESGVGDEERKVETYPGTLGKDLAGEPVARSGDEARRAGQELVVDDADLHQILGHRATLDVVPVRLGDPPEKVDRVRVREVEVKHVQDVALGLEDLVVRVPSVGHEQEVRHRRAHDLLVLGGDEQGGDADELELDERDDAGGQEAIDDVGREENGLRQQAELGMNLDEPVDEHPAHLPRHLALVRHVVRIGQRRQLRAKEEIGWEHSLATRVTGRLGRD